MPLKIGKAEIKTPYVVAAGATALVLVIYGVVKKRQADAAAAAARAEAAGNIDPATGDIAGSAQDQADLAAQQGGAGLDYGSYGAYGGLGGGLGGYGGLYPNTQVNSGPNAIDPNSGIPYAEEAGWVYNDQSGTWSYHGTGSGNVGGGTFTTNAEWLQAVEQYFTTNGLVSDGGVALTSALGKFLAGAPVTPDQETLIQEAMGVENPPPVSGPGGYPPGIHLQTTQTKPPPSGTVTVPNVTGQGFGAAYNALVRAGLKPSPGQGKVNANAKVTSQNPTAGTQVARGSTVTLTTPPPPGKK